jgi:hypothetical protein
VGAGGGCREAAVLGERAINLLRMAPAPVEKSREQQRLLQVARYCLNVRSLESMNRSIDYCAQVIETGTTDAAPYLLLANSYLALTSYGVVSARSIIPKAREAVERALALEPQRAECHATLGTLILMYDWNFAAADRCFQRAVAINVHRYGPG